MPGLLLESLTKLPLYSDKINDVGTSYCLGLLQQQQLAQALQRRMSCSRSVDGSL